LRLHPQELAYIVNHADDRFLIVDDVLLPLWQQFCGRTKVERVFVVNHGNSEDALHSGAQGYEALLAQARGDFVYPQAGENDAAAMCFTSGTTGNSKGVLYSHRAIVLHALAFALPDALAISQHDVVMALAPMFHANAHGVPHVALMLGSKVVLPGRQLDAVSVLDLFHSEQVTFATAVPTVWTTISEALGNNPGRWKLAPGLRGFVGGTAVPESLVRKLDQQGIRLTQVWGMTETTPVAVCSTLKAHMRSWPPDEQYRVRIRAGRPLPFVEARVVNDHGEAPWDGKTLGELQVRGPWVASSYFRAPETADRWTSDGWLRTGDVANIDAEGYVQICDRAKDLIKSGGEWISSVDVENALAAHPAVREAGVIAVSHPKWDERPLAVVVLSNGATATAEELRAFLSSKFAKWQLPDAFVFLDELPHTSTGKLSKLELRKRFAGWQWNSGSAG